MPEIQPFENKGLDQKYPFYSQYPSAKLKRLIHFFRHHAIRLANLSYDTNTGLHIVTKSAMEWRIFNDIFIDGDYDKPILHLLSAQRKQSIQVLDLGSNVGFFVQRLIHLAISRSNQNQFLICGIEASRELCNESISRFQKSNFSKKVFQINIQSGLIGQLEGQGTFYQFKDHGLNSVFRKNGKPETIPFINISNLISSWNEIDLIKCDIEGSELDFLKNYSALLEITSAAVFEFHTELCDYNSCKKILRAAGFTNGSVIRKSPHLIIEFFWK